ncbi:hypothetical protein SAMN05660748_2380 [Blastococcus aggregatus]|uniref:Uncharacterized protein n=1 Tax=Blastococcus aggregatus TaxID=38502 RepID=A0A285V6G8_9ACTN|nr:hypothetical protein [Blastococcus aggregatus]SOC49649.1 hypothetical protein SAMN05660748_2380 [Blastococcus aggregatus]
MTDLTTPRAPERPHPVPVPRDELPAEPPRPGGDPVELARLLALVRLTAPQAVVIAGQLLAARAEREQGSATEPVRARLTPDGRIVLDPTPAPATGEPLDRVLADIAAAARRPAGAASPLAAELLAELDRAVAAVRSEDADVAGRRLAEAAARVDGPAVRAELAALAGAVRGLPSGAGGGAPAPPRPAPVRTAAAPRPPRRPRPAGRRIGAWLLSLVVLGAVVTAEVVLLGDDITSDIDLLLDAGRGGERPPDEPEPDGLPVVAPAPASAGSVVAVDLRRLASCATGAPCTVRLFVRLLPSPEPQVLTWSYRVVDRCTGASTSVPGGSLPVAPQADRVAVVAEVPLPPLAGVALIAVTEAPAAAASAPVSTGSCLPAGPGA